GGGVFRMVGVREDEALKLSEGLDQRMADSILALYRSATTVQDEWGPAFNAIPKPGMVVVPTADPFLAESGARRAGERAGARIETLEGRGHWWMLEDPAGAATLLESFWSSI